MEKAIRHAVEGGYDVKKGLNWPDNLGSSNDMESVAAQVFPTVILLDPLFWQAVGKTCGWRKHRGCGGNGICPEYPHCCEGGGETWKYHWHSFIDHLAEGKDVDSFFTNLLK